MGKIGIMTASGAKGRLAKLKKHWRKASPEERSAFAAWLGLDDGQLPIAAGRYLTPVSVARVRAEIARRRMDLDALNRAVGLEPGDASLARALLEGMPLRLSVIGALERWLEGDEEKA